MCIYKIYYAYCVTCKVSLLTVRDSVYMNGQCADIINSMTSLTRFNNVPVICFNKKYLIENFVMFHMLNWLWDFNEATQE
jgi:hypothetical protein